MKQKTIEKFKRQENEFSRYWRKFDYYMTKTARENLDLIKKFKNDLKNEGLNKVVRVSHIKGQKKYPMIDRIDFEIEGQKYNLCSIKDKFNFNIIYSSTKKDSFNDWTYWKILEYLVERHSK